MKEIISGFSDVRNLGAGAVLVAGAVAIVRILIRSLTGSVTLREQTIQQIFIKILEQSSEATAQTREATTQAAQLAEILSKVESSIGEHTKVMKQQAETNAKLFEALVSVLKNTQAQNAEARY